MNARQRRERLMADLALYGDLANDDAEAAHGGADVALLEFIDDPEITAAYEAITPRWRA